MKTKIKTVVLDGKPAAGRTISVLAVLFGIALCLPGSTIGATYDASTGYVTMTANDNAPYPDTAGQAFKSFDADGTLSTGWGVIGKRWSDGEYTHSGTNYFAGKTFYAHGVTGTPTPFKGESLVVGPVNLIFTGSANMSIAFNDKTTFNTGAGLTWNSVGHVLGGKITLNGSVLNPNRFQHKRRTSGAYEVKFTSELRGSGRATIQYTDDTVGNPIDTTVNIKDASWAEFTGTMSLLHRLPVKSESNAFSFPGTLALLKDASWEFTKSSGHHTFGTLDLAKDSTLIYGAGATDVTVTNKLVLSEGAGIRAKKISGCTLTPVTNKFMTLSASAVAAGVPDVKGALRLEAGCTTYGLLPRTLLVTNELADGGWDLYVSSKPVVTLTNNTAKAKTPFAWGDSRREDDNPVHYLNDGQAFHAGVDYLASGRNVIVITRNAQEEFVTSDDYVFPGDSLTLSASGLGLYHGCFFNELTLCGGARFRPMLGNGSSAKSYPRNTYAIGGSLVVMGTGYAECGDNATWRFDCNMSGDGTLGLRLTPETSAGIGNTRGWVELAGDNVAFKGQIDVMESVAGSFKARFEDKGFEPFVSGPSSNITLVVHGPTSLGGPLPAMKADAIKIGNNNRLAFAETAEFDAENRGLTFVGTAYFQTASNEVVATVKNRIAWGSKAVKEGEGTLRFGSAPILSDTTPKLVVEKGFVGVTDSAALEGIDVEMAAGTGLYADAAAQGEVLVKGLTLTGTISVPTRLRLRIANVPEDGDVKVAVMTAPTALATTVRNALVADHVAKHSVKLSVEPAADGMSTVFATVARSGLMLIFR